MEGAPPAEQPVVLQLVERYIKLRDAKAEIARVAKEKAARIDTVQKRIEAALLAQFNQLGLDNVKTAAGTAYKSTRTSATVADRDAMLEWVIANENWNFIESRVNKTAVEEFRNEHNDLPPGINWSEEIVINVRRS
jgi:hypothetical protein